MKILISGYYGFGNAGDEWILESLLKNLLANKHDVTVLSADPASTRGRHGIKAVNRLHLLALVRSLRKCDILISGGGGLIQDLSGPWTPLYYLGLLAAARSLGKRVLLVGQGFGPLRRTGNQWLCQRVLPHAELVVPRDAPGRAWCRSMGVAGERLFLGADWVWSLSAPRPRPGKDWAVCLRADGLRPGEPGWLADLLALAQARGRRVRFLVLGNRGDRECLSGIGLKAVREQDVVDLTGATWAQAAARLSGVEWLLSMRYHGLILGAACGAAVAGWGNDPKIGNLLQELQAPDLRNVPGREALKSLLAGGAAARRLQKAGVIRLRQRARNMAVHLQKFLLKR